MKRYWWSQSDNPTPANTHLHFQPFSAGCFYQWPHARWVHLLAQSNKFIILIICILMTFIPFEIIIHQGLVAFSLGMMALVFWTLTFLQCPLTPSHFRGKWFLHEKHILGRLFQNWPKVPKIFFSPQNSLTLSYFYILQTYKILFVSCCLYSHPRFKKIILFRCASISWIHVGEWVSQSVIN